MAEPPDLPRSLLGLARDDEFAARSLLPVAGIADAILGFHSQQAVEKALKAALASRDIQFPYTHDLDGLIELCRSNGFDVPATLDGVECLAPYGVHMRYGTSRASKLDRDQALRWAASAIAWAQDAIELAHEQAAHVDSEPSE
jgi:HEPN domain-containing protein